MKQLKQILLRYRGMVDIEIIIEEISNGYLVNRKYFPTREDVQIEVMDIIKDPGLLYGDRK